MINTDLIAKYLGSWAEEINIYSTILKIFLAIFLSAIIGFERSSKRHAAGLRTFILVTLTSCIAMIIELYILNDVSNGLINIGLTLIMSSAVIVAVSIISSNTILYSSRNQIKGLTTATALWGCAIFGLLIGTGEYTIVLIFFIVYLIILSGFPSIEIYLKNRSNHFEIHLELKNSLNLQNFISTIRQLGLRVDDLESNPAYVNSGLSVYTISVSIIKKELKQYKTHKEIIEALKSIDYIYHIEEI